jgi:hypothetical protein
MAASVGAAVGGGEPQVRGFRKEVRGAGLFRRGQGTQSPNPSAHLDLNDYQTLRIDYRAGQGHTG